MLEAVRIITRFQDVAVMRNPVKQRSRHLCITKYLHPFTERKIGGNNQRGLLIKMADEMKQQCAA